MQISEISRSQRTSGGKILVVDDVADVRLLIRLGISKILPKAQVHESESGMMASIALIKNEFDLVISDLEMDSGNGFWLHCVMDTQHKKTPLVFFTGNPDKVRRLSHSRRVFSKNNMDGLLKEVARVIEETHRAPRG